MEEEKKDSNFVEMMINPQLAKLEKAILQLGKKEQDILKSVDWSSLLNPEKQIYYKAEEIANMLGKGWTGTKVNEILREMQYQFLFKKDYLPTKKGVESGCFHRLILLDFKETSTAFSFSLMWTINIVDKIKEYVEGKNIIIHSNEQEEK